MGNIIRFDKNAPAEEWLSMSNGATDGIIVMPLLRRVKEFIHKL